MKNVVEKSFIIAAACLVASISWAAEVTFTMSDIFDGQKLSFDVTSPVSAKVSSNTSKGNAPQGKLGSTNNYFEIILNNDTYSSAKINGYINTTNTSGYDWGFQFSTDKGATWSQTVSQPNDGNKTVHEITVNATIPANANGFRVVRLAGTSTVVASVVLNLDGGGGTPVTPTVNSVTVSPASVTLDPNNTQQLTATVDATPASADKTVTWTTSNANVATVSESGLVTAVAQGTATITATSNLDNTKSGTCSVTVNAPTAPIPVTAIALNSTTTIAIGDSETLTIIYTPADANTGKAVTWTSSNTSVATVDNSGKVTGVAVGTATITATSTTDASITASCNVTVQAVAVTSVSINPTSANLQIGGSTDLTYTILPANATDKSVSWSSSNTSVATVNNGHVTAIAAGTATITVTTTDGNKTATCSVTVTAGPPVPYTTLTTHVPEIYEAKEIAGGYGGTLSVFGSREYEVFYINRDNSSNLTIATSNVDKAGNICDDTSTSNKAKTKDGWLTINCNGTGGDSNAGTRDEFQSSIRSAKFNSSSHVMEMHIQGYDQFSFYGKDNNQNPDKGKMFELYIDGVKQTRTPQDYAINRFDISTGEHVIKLTAIGGSDSKLCSFSLRVAQEPRTKWLKGNDSTQRVLQTQAIQPITYVTKYNNIPGAETRLEWIGDEARGISLQEVGGDLTDTLLLSGVANCPIGTYNYAVVAYYNGVETSRATGSFRIATDIQAMTELTVDVYQNEEMDQIKFRYYALDESVVKLTWQNGQPAGIAGSGATNNTYIIGGTPTAAEGVYKFEITAIGADTTFKGSINVKKLDYGQNPVLYLYKNTGADEKDGVYTHLKNKNWNVISRKAKEDGLRPADQYSKYKWILISEDADSNNEEVLAVVRGGASLPVLNMNAFSYAYERNEDTPNGWGEPDNGSISEGGRYITVQRADHPIFKTLNKKKGDRIQVLDTVIFRGLMPINIKQQGTLCLATSPTRNIEDYEADGEMQTIIHEIPAGMRGGTKYIGFPMSKHSTEHLTSDGKKTLDAIVSYLLSPEPTVFVPTVQITGFSLNGIAGKIDQSNNTIQVSINRNEYPDIDLVNAQPVVTLADPQTTVTPASGETVDLSTSNILPVKYVVTDFINRRVYNVSVTFYSPEGIEEVYTAGDWINIYDIFGRKIATTNEDVYTMSLPRGVYIIVNENGNTFKITR